MEQSRIQSAFFVAIFGVILILNFFIFRHFFTVLLIALTLAVLFNPIHSRIRSYLKNENFAALVTTLLVLLIVVVPLGFFAQRLFLEAQSFLTGLNGTDNTFVNTALEKLRGLNASTATLDLNQYLRNIVGSILNNVGAIFSSIFNVIFTFILMLLSLFFFLRDGDKLKKAVYKLSPLPHDADEKVFDKMEVVINSVIRGQMMVAIAQSLIAIAGFTIFGVPNPVLWGAIVVVAAFIPTIGTALVTIPAIAYLYFNGHVGATIGLAIWCIVAVGMIDNVLGPILINRRIKLHPFVILLAVLGGITTFGPVGFIIGPLIVTMLIALFEVRNLITSN